MFLAQPRHDQPDFRLFLIGHAYFPNALRNRVRSAS
jgi:hypothetical protein